MMRLPRLLLLCSLLLWAQSTLAVHGIEHARHDQDEACIECLALPGMQAVPAQAVRCGMVPRVAEALERAVPPAPTFARHLAFRSRAPPPAQSC